MRVRKAAAMLIGGQYITTPELIGQWLIERWVKEKEGV
jgi:hypothetical protein